MSLAKNILTYWIIALGVSLFFSFIPRSSNPTRPGVYENKGRFLITPWYMRFGQLFSLFIAIWFMNAWDKALQWNWVYLTIAILFFLLAVVLFFWGYGQSMQRKS